ncbi:hypothetical protein NSS98_08155 [Paenibacillus sp. FSL E2-0274]|uniref:hypothetical protein n=1 Tax=Paenibacillus TaxID=44249 RepID=UPI00096D390A|nr:hypothetical protein [Paenibacillus odorifer]OME23846.1 hypothetical protein BSK57_15445 [Paenibacillus odorifer]OME33601.1 hypothetical protein BSK63_10130 [Paenibacillus odorifer]OME38785.1 hypothetical protein BSK58_19175 [Paenibacillus odorifer]OME39609.1 hypothetical protein BSK46_10310 [Paenibacillus odorifer]
MDSRSETRSAAAEVWTAAARHGQRQRSSDSGSGGLDSRSEIRSAAAEVPPAAVEFGQRQRNLVMRATEKYRKRSKSH